MRKQYLVCNILRNKWAQNQHSAYVHSFLLLFLSLCSLNLPRWIIWTGSLNTILHRANRKVSWHWRRSSSSGLQKETTINWSAYIDQIVPLSMNTLNMRKKIQMTYRSHCQQSWGESPTGSFFHVCRPIPLTCSSRAWPVLGPCPFLQQLTWFSLEKGDVQMSTPVSGVSNSALKFTSFLQS